MNIGQLIDALSKFDPHAEVYVEDRLGGFGFARCQKDAEWRVVNQPTGPSGRVVCFGCLGYWLHAKSPNTITHLGNPLPVTN